MPGTNAGHPYPEGTDLGLVGEVERSADDAGLGYNGNGPVEY